MNKSEYLRLLSEASINDSSKFQAVPLERPSSKGRPPTYYHPLLKKEKDLDAIVRRILPESIADTVRPTGSRLAHLYGFFAYLFDHEVNAYSSSLVNLIQFSSNKIVSF